MIWGIPRAGGSLLYRVTHLMVHSGWVDFDYGCSTLCLVLPGLLGNWQNWLISWARWWNIPNPSQPNPGLSGELSPCSFPMPKQAITTFSNNRNKTL